MNEDIFAFDLKERIAKAPKAVELNYVANKAVKHFNSFEYSVEEMKNIGKNYSNLNEIVGAES